MTRRLLFIVLGTTLALGTSTAAHNVSAALIINANFDDGTQPFAGPAAGPEGAGTWNQVTPSTLSLDFSFYPPDYVKQTLVDSSGAPSGVTAFLPGDPLDATAPTPPAISLFDGYIYGNTSVVLTNVPTGTYDLYLYSSNGSNANESTNFTVNGVGPLLVDNVAFGITPSTNSFVPGGNYVEFTGVTPSSGVITIAFADGGRMAQSAFNGFQLVSSVSVPEPSSVVLLGIGLGVAAVTARRRRKS